MNKFWPLLLVFSGCKDKDSGAPVDDTADPVTDGDADTDTDTDTDTDAPCTTAVTNIDPATGATGVYYRDPVTVTFDADGGAATFSLTDGAGAPATFTTTWTAGNNQAILDTVLAADTTYTLSVDMCGVVTQSSFTTSSLGAPLTVAPGDLVGRTYSWRLSESTITQPTFLDALSGVYLTTPLLVAVTAADETSIDIIGALGYVNRDGAMVQQLDEPTWDFPAGDFSEQPYFEAYAESITLSFDGTAIPVEGFQLNGTFSADGTTIEHGTGEGLADSRYLDELLGGDGAVCGEDGLAQAAGYECEACADGQVYCLYVVVEDITAEWEQGLSLTPVE